MMMFDRSVFAMGAAPDRRQPLAAARAVRARARHLLLHHPAADAKRSSRRCRSFSSSLKVGDKVITTGGIYGQVTRLGEQTRADADRRQGPHRSVEGRRSAAIRARRRCQEPRRSAEGLEIMQNLRWKLITISPSSWCSRASASIRLSRRATTGPRPAGCRTSSSSSVWTSRAACTSCCACRPTMRCSSRRIRRRERLREELTNARA